MSKLFEGQVILITGAGSGIGRATAIKLSQLGAILALTDINPHSLFEISDLLSLTQQDKCWTDVSGVSKVGECKFSVSHIIECYGRLDDVFNCAGINPTSYPTAEITDEYWDLIMNTT